MGTSAFVSCFSVKTLGWEVPPARHPDTRILGVLESTQARHRPRHEAMLRALFLGG